MNSDFKAPVRLKRVDSLTAIYPTNQFRSTATLADYSSQFGEVVVTHPTDPTQPLPPGPPLPDFTPLETAGWRIVAPKGELEKAAELRQPVPNAKVAGEIYVTDTGTMLVGTSLATVKLPPDLSTEQAEQVLQEDGLVIVQKLGFGRNIYEVRIPPGIPLLEAIDKLQNGGRYVWVEPSMLQAVKHKEAPAPLLIPADPEFKLQWQHRNTGLVGIVNVGGAGEDLDSLKAWQITKGEGVRIAIIDSGMEITHPDLAEGIVGGGFFRSDESGQSVFVPLVPGMTNFPNGEHGTFCMGLAASRTHDAGQENEGGCGIAPEADLIAIACPIDQLVTSTTLARAIHFAVDPSAFIESATPDSAAHVISCSLDTPLFSVLGEAIGFAATEGRKKDGVSLGVPIFWAIDNNSARPITDDPVCCLPEVTAVGKYDRVGRWGGGAIGDQVAFLAPGVDVFSTGMNGHNNKGTGTSFATPLAAGVAALVLAVNSDLTATEVRQKLVQSCEPVHGPQNQRQKVGAGKLNAFRAVS